MTPPVTGWSRDNLRRAERLLESYPDPRSAVMPLLYLAAEEHGSVSASAQRDVSALTGLTPAQVQSVASFYTMYKRHRPGTYLISVCTSISCFLLGADEVLDVVADTTGTPDGETSADGLFSVEHVECIGACGGAPAVQVNYELIEGVTPAKGRDLCRWLKDAQPGVVFADEMQQLFGGTRSFEWGPTEADGARLPLPSLRGLGTASAGGQRT